MASLLFSAVSLLIAREALAAPTVSQKQGIRTNLTRYISSGAAIDSETGAVYNNFDGGGWIIPVLIGGQQVILNVDTGSSDLYAHLITTVLMNLTNDSATVGPQVPSCPQTNSPPSLPALSTTPA